MDHLSANFDEYSDSILLSASDVNILSTGIKYKNYFEVLLLSLILLHFLFEFLKRYVRT